MYAMAGSSRRPYRITGNTFGNTFRQSANLADAQGCRAYQNPHEAPHRQGVLLPQPDGGYPRARGRELEPCILVEVGSPSPKNPDLREKLLAYKSIPSLQT